MIRSIFGVGIEVFGSGAKRVYLKETLILKESFYSKRANKLPT